MPYFGELLSLLVAVLWTATALFADTASHRLGALPLNVIRMAMSLVMLALLLLAVTGSVYPLHADGTTWLWLALSGLVGYVFGDYCLFNAYVIFGSKFGQLFMTLAPPIAGVTGWLLLGEALSWHAWVAMAVTLFGIGFSIVVRSGHSLHLRLPLKGVLFGLGAGIGQGVGLVLSKIGLNHYADTCAALKEVFGWFWVGFYMVKDGQLHLGPFQGPVACTRIAKGRGVCGTAWEKAQTLVVADVDAFPGHIACSSLSRSEIVVPLIREDEVLGVLDIDSEKLATFDAIDKRFLEELMTFAAEGLECY